MGSPPRGRREIDELIRMTRAIARASQLSVDASRALSAGRF
jgi:hypothetical protein